MQTNRALVTSLSHDLRTPLTKQIGYLEILQRQMYRSEEERRGYQEQVWKKALQMKDLSDRIFQTFQVDGGETAQPPEVVSGGGLLGIALGVAGTLIPGRLILNLLVLPNLVMSAGAFAFSVLLGVGFGMYPAVKASGLQPVAALRAD